MPEQVPGTPQSSASHRPRRKTSNACQRCKSKKIKCSGDTPCQHCASHSARCTFEDVGKRVMISERHLQHLRDTISRLEKQASKGRDSHPPWSTPADSSVIDSVSLQEQTRLLQPVALPKHRNVPAEDSYLPPVPNPLTSSRSFFATDSAGRQRYLGHSSTWSFSWQIRSFVKDAIGATEPVNLTPSAEGATYGMASVPFSKSGPFPSDLPCFEYAEYLVNTTVFHLGSTYYLFNKDSFLFKLTEFYKSGPTTELSKQLSDLWHAQVLFVIALGKLFLSDGATSFGPPGAAEFLRGMQLTPDITGLYEDPILGIENLCLISLYLLSADMRNAAYGFIGQAHRIALSLGMNREIPPGFLNEAECEHRRRLWWTVYIIDVKVSINMGSPLSLQDEDIDIALPSLDGSSVNSALRLHVKVIRLTRSVLEAAYHLKGRLNAAFISGIQDVFSLMPKLAEDFTGRFDLNLAKPGGLVFSRAAATLHLSYHQCTILATRPIAFMLVQKRLTPPQGSLMVPKAPSEAVLTILKTCIEAASATMKILSVLHSHNRLEPFFPFDLEATFSAASVLILVKIAHPALPIDEGCLTAAKSILDWMCGKGNAVARSRRQEFEEIQSLATLISIRQDQQTLSSPNLATDQLNNNWLWDLLDIEGVAHASEATEQVLLMEPGLLSDQMLEDRWFWAGDGTFNGDESVF